MPNFSDGDDLDKFAAEDAAMDTTADDSARKPSQTAVEGLREVSQNSGCMRVGIEPCDCHALLQMTKYNIKLDFLNLNSKVAFYEHRIILQL